MPAHGRISAFFVIRWPQAQAQEREHDDRSKRGAHWGKSDGMRDTSIYFPKRRMAVEPLRPLISIVNFKSGWPARLKVTCS